MRSFFIVVPPGFEHLALSELNTKIPGLKVLSLEKGGILVEAPLVVGLSLNWYLKIPSAIFLRIAEFKCRDLPKLYNKVSNIRWSQYLLGSEFTLDVSSQKSRLLNEKKIAKAVDEGILRYFEKQPAKKTNIKRKMEIKVRFYNDTCAVSWNTSGEALFKRGYKTLAGVAPIRENLAAALFWALWQSSGGFSALVDPMCGTGTLLLEAYQFWNPQSRVDFDFIFKEDITSEKIIFETPCKINIYGYDKEKKNLALVQENLARLPGEKSNFSLMVRDILCDEPIAGNIEDAVVICNPPYGERLKLPEPPNTYYRKLIEKLLSYQPKAVGIILPCRYSSFVAGRFSGYTEEHKIQFENGGIPVEFRILKKA